MFKFVSLVTGLLINLAVQADWRDPTTPGNFSATPQATGATPLVTFDVTEILITDTTKRAIINGVTFKTGDYLNDDTRLIKILPGHVLIKQQDSIKKLYLVPSVKKPLK